jgi:hypothetical protein
MKSLILSILLIFLSISSLGQTIRYVDINNPTPVSPFTNGWASAATNIQDALDVSNNTNNIILVSNGIYRTGGRAGASLYNEKLTNRVLIFRHNITLKSVNGPDVTIIEGRWNNDIYTSINTNQGGTFGSNSVRCLWVAGTNATIDGFTFTKGSTMRQNEGVTFQQLDRLGAAITVNSNANAHSPIIVTNCKFDTIAAWGRPIIDVRNGAFQNLSFSNIYSVSAGSTISMLFNLTQSTNIITNIKASHINRSITNFYIPSVAQLIAPFSANDILSDIEIYSCDFGSNTAYGVIQNIIVGPVINKLKVYNNTNMGVIANRAENSIIENNHFYTVGGKIISAYLKNSIIRNNIQSGSSIDALSSTNINVIIANNYLSLFFPTSGSNIFLNCTIMNNSFQSIGATITNRVFIYNSYFSQNTNRIGGVVFSNYPAIYIDSTSITTNLPMILSDGSYRLSPNSEAIDRGGSHPFISDTDVYDNKRIAGENIDIGAVEYFDAPMILPFGDWSILYNELSSVFPSRITASVSRMRINLNTFPTNSNGLSYGELWRDGNIIKVKQ